MRTSFGLPALVAMVLVPAAAAAAPITVGESATLVIDVEFWGRLCPCGYQQLDPKDPGPGRLFIGDPVQGAFRIWPDDAPAPTRTSGWPDENMVVYGRETIDTPAASFVTSRLRSPFPHGFENVSPFPGGTADDLARVGDGVRLSGTRRRDVFVVSDSFTKNFRESTQVEHRLIVHHHGALIDTIQGLGLEQEFDVATPFEGGHAGYGWYENSVGRVRKAFDFVIDRFRVSKHLVCRP